MIQLKFNISIKLSFEIFNC